MPADPLAFWADGFAGQKIFLARWPDVQLAPWSAGALILLARRFCGPLICWPAGFAGPLVLLARWFADSLICWFAGFVGLLVLLARWFC